MTHWSPRRRLRRAHAGRRCGEEGQTNAEYALIVAGIAVILIAVVWSFGGSTEGRLTTTASNIPGGSLTPPSGTVLCDSHYTGACIPPAPPRLSCGALKARGVKFPASVVGGDPHGLDKDGNGVACG